MANLTTVPAIDWFETTLSSSWNGAVWSVAVNDVPSWTIESWETSYIVVNPWKDNMQVARIDWWDSWSKTFNVTSITVEKGNGVNYTAQTHAANSVVRFSNNYAFWKDIRTAINSKAGTDTDNTWTWTQTVDKLVATGYIKDAIYADATARDTAIPSPSNWMRIYNTAVGLFQKYQAWAWVDDTAWGSVPNASETVAGKVEKATAWEVTAGTSTWGTGAELFVWPAQLKTVTDALVVPDATDTVKGKVELATDAEWKTWTDTTRVMTVNTTRLVLWEIIPWTAITYWAADTERTSSLTSMTKVKEILMNNSWNYTVSFDLKASVWWASAVNARIYVNWVAVWTNRSSSSATYVSFSETINIRYWDLIQLYYQTVAWTHAIIRNFRVTYNTTTNTDWTVNLD